MIPFGELAKANVSASVFVATMGAIAQLKQSGNADSNDLTALVHRGCFALVDLRRVLRNIAVKRRNAEAATTKARAALDAAHLLLAQARAELCYLTQQLLAQRLATLRRRLHLLREDHEMQRVAIAGVVSVLTF